MLAAVSPAGRLEGSKLSVTVTGWVNCCPSGPKVTAVPTGVAAGGGGALWVGVTLMVTLAGSAPAGTVTPEPSEALTDPPVVPTACCTGGGSGGADEEPPQLAARSSAASGKSRVVAGDDAAWSGRERRTRKANATAEVMDIHQEV